MNEACSEPIGGETHYILHFGDLSDPLNDVIWSTVATPGAPVEAVIAPPGWVLNALARGEPVAFTKVSELAGKRLALTKGYAYGESVTRAPGVQLVVKNNDADCLRAVLSKQADYVLLDQLLVRHLFDFHASKAGGLIEAGEVPIVRYPLYFAVRRAHPQAAQIIA